MGEVRIVLIFMLLLANKLTHNYNNAMGIFSSMCIVKTT